MGNYKRIGNFGIIDTGRELVSVGLGGGFGGDVFNFSSPTSWSEDKQRIGKYDIVPMGVNNDMPLELQRMLDEFYSGEGILGKIQGLQWGMGPRLYQEEYTEDGDIRRRWVMDEEIWSWLRSWDFENELLKCHTDLVHGFGYFYKVYRNLGTRIGLPGKIVELRHVPVDKCRFEYPMRKSGIPDRIVTGGFPYPDVSKMSAFPIFNRQDPFRYGISMGYSNIYSFCKSFYSTPRFLGAYSWIKLASGIAPLLQAYNTNASAISYHVESPKEYWENAMDGLKQNCELRGVPYTDKMLEDYKEATFEEFSKALTGQENVGKFFHTTQEFSHLKGDYSGWKVTPLDKKIKDYVDAQIAIANKADSASTSGFGLHPSLSNIMVEGKMASGSEMLYALKAYIATETAIPEQILFGPFNDAMEANFPGSGLRLGFYRQIVSREEDVSPGNRVSNSV